MSPANSLALFDTSTQTSPVLDERRMNALGTRFRLFKNVAVKMLVSGEQVRTATDRKRPPPHKLLSDGKRNSFAAVAPHVNSDGKSGRLAQMHIMTSFIGNHPSIATNREGTGRERDRAANVHRQDTDWINQTRQLQS